MRLVDKLEKLVKQQREGKRLPKNWRKEVSKLVKGKVEERKKLQHAVIHSPERSERKKAWKELQKVDEELKRIEEHMLKLIGKSQHDSPKN